MLSVKIYSSRRGLSDRKFQQECCIQSSSRQQQHGPHAIAAPPGADKIIFDGRLLMHLEYQIRSGKQIAVNSRPTASALLQEATAEIRFPYRTMYARLKGAV
jgi:hypothetical protein